MTISACYPEGYNMKQDEGYWIFNDDWINHEATARLNEPDGPTIKDSGNRTQFNTGAVRDMHQGKGRMDLLPWKGIIKLSKHCENGAEKYGEHNVDKGILLHSLIDSGARHLGLFISGEADEDHLVAAAWNIMWALQFRETMSELNDLYYWKGEDQCSETDATIAE